MATDLVRIAFVLHNDSRLIAAISVIACHAARHAGLSEKDQDDLATAAVEACRETFQVTGHREQAQPVIRMVIESVPGRVEVAIESNGAASETERSLGAGREGARRENPRCGARGNCWRVILVKDRSAQKSARRN